VRRNFAEGGLRKWVAEKWGRHWSTKEGREISTVREKQRLQEEISKCVPLAKATQMTSSQKASAVKRKRAAGNPGGKPTNVKTFAKK
jgi:hypothetical protein